MLSERKGFNLKKLVSNLKPMFVGFLIGVFSAGVAYLFLHGADGPPDRTFWEFGAPAIIGCIFGGLVYGLLPDRPK